MWRGQFQASQFSNILPPQKMRLQKMPPHFFAAWDFQQAPWLNAPPPPTPHPLQGRDDNALREVDFNAFSEIQTLNAQPIPHGAPPPWGLVRFTHSYILQRTGRQIEERARNV